jgi:hypothetical protein
VLQKYKDVMVEGFNMFLMSYLKSSLCLRLRATLHPFEQ